MIMVKSIAERFKWILNSTISASLNAFIEGGPIIDPILVANEAVEECRNWKL